MGGGWLGEWELKAEWVFLVFLPCSLLDVKVFVVSVLGVLHGFISGLCPCVTV